MLASPFAGLVPRTSRAITAAAALAALLGGPSASAQCLGDRWELPLQRISADYAFVAAQAGCHQFSWRCHLR